MNKEYKFVWIGDKLVLKRIKPRWFPNWFDTSPDELLDWLILPIVAFSIGLIIDYLFEYLV